MLNEEDSAEPAPEAQEAPAQAPAGGAPPNAPSNAQYIQITPAERDAIDRVSYPILPAVSTVKGTLGSHGIRIALEFPRGKSRHPKANCCGVVIMCRRVRYRSVDLRTDLPSFQRVFSKLSDNK